jgi:hypothetical protein
LEPGLTFRFGEKNRGGPTPAAARGNKSTFTKNKLPRAHRGKTQKRVAVFINRMDLCHAKRN